MSREKEVFMKHVPMNRIAGVLFIIFALSVTTLYADTTQKDIDQAKGQIDDLKEQKKDAEEHADDAAQKKQRQEEELKNFNSQLSGIVSSMNELEGRIADKQTEIENAETELKKAEKRFEKQYEDMKLRIQYIYENGSISAMQMLLESGSIAEFLNRAEYIREINEYDRQMLARFQALKDEIAAQKEELEGSMQELLSMQESMKEKQSSVNSLIAAAKSNIDKFSQELAAAQSDVEQLDSRIADMIEYEKQLEIQKAREDAARLEAIRAQEKEDTSGVVYVPAGSDAYLLGAIIQCEAGGESYDGKLAVGSVVLNRVKSSYFPNSISGVIYQDGQFSPVASGRLAMRLQSGVDSSCLQAAQDVLGGTVTTGCLYFRTNNGIIQGTVIGNHVFY